MENTNTWLLKPFTEKHRAFFWIPCCSEVQFVSMLPSTVPLQRCIPVLTVTLRSPCCFHFFLPTASIFAIFLAIFRKAIIRLHGCHFHWFLNGNYSHSFSKDPCKAGEQFQFTRSPSGPLSAGLARLPPGIPRLQRLRPKHFPPSKLTECRA